jgi:hypothetical protein
MPSDSGAAHGASRLIYPKLSPALTPADLHRLFTPTYDERRWAPAVARTEAAQVALLVHLGLFKTMGRFLPVEEIPPRVIEHVARELNIACEPKLEFSDSTVYRRRSAVLERLKITAWGGAARQLTHRTMCAIAEARTEPVELINAAVDALVRHRFELPSLDALRRLAQSVHNRVNTAQWQRVSEALSEKKRSALEALLEVEAQLQESPFARLCRTPGRPSRNHLKALIERYHWLQGLPDPIPALESIADSKVLQWANEARRLKAPELRRYIAPRRHALLLASLRQARGQLLDDLTVMLLKLVRQVEHKSEQALLEWYAERRGQTDALIRTFRDSLKIHAGEAEPALKIAQLETLFAERGGREALEQGCTEYLRHEKKNWRPFARAVFVPLHSVLLRLADLLPLQCTEHTSDLLSVISAMAGELPPYTDYVHIQNIGPEAVPAPWRSLVHDSPENPQAFNRRQTEVVAVLELAEAIRAGAMFVCGSLSYDRFWDRLPEGSRRSCGHRRLRSLPGVGGGGRWVHSDA